MPSERTHNVVRNPAAAMTTFLDKLYDAAKNNQGTLAKALQNFQKSISEDESDNGYGLYILTSAISLTEEIEYFIVANSLDEREKSRYFNTTARIRELLSSTKLSEGALQNRISALKTDLEYLDIFVSSRVKNIADLEDLVCTQIEALNELREKIIALQIDSVLRMRILRSIDEAISLLTAIGPTFEISDKVNAALFSSVVAAPEAEKKDIIDWMNKRVNLFNGIAKVSQSVVKLLENGKDLIS